MLRWSVRFVAVAAIFTVAGMLASTAAAQGRGGFGGGFGGFGGAGLINNPDVRKELEIVDEQIEKITAIRERQNENRPQFPGRDATDEERNAFRTKMQENQKEIEAVLLPQQRERLAQISLQQRIQFMGVVQAITTGDIAEQIGVTDDQKSKMEDAAKDAEKELQDKIAKARVEARDKVLSNLSTEQKDKIKKLLGPEFKFTTQQQGFGRGGAGGAGGNQPGQRGQRGQRGGNRGNQGGNRDAI
jgi:Spy/CpxP family protein refolding chaperone